MALLNVRTCAPPSPIISLSKRTEYIILVDNTLQAQSPLCALTLLAVSCRIRVTFVSLPLSQCCTARNLLKSRALFCRVYYLYQFPSLSVAIAVTGVAVFGLSSRLARHSRWVVRSSSAGLIGCRRRHRHRTCCKGVVKCARVHVCHTSSLLGGRWW